MTKGFEKQKRKFWRATLCKSGIAVLSVALAVVGVLLLCDKLTGAHIPVWSIVLGALLGGAAAGAIVLLLYLPTDARVAANLDAEYKLGEKVQTMVAFRDREGDVVALQRADTDARLLALPPQKIKFSRIWQYILVGVLAVAIFVTSLCVPAAAKAEAPIVTPPPVIVDPTEPEQPDPNAFTYTVQLQADLAQLRYEIDESELTGALMKEFLAAIDDLDARLRVQPKEDGKAVTLSDETEDGDGAGDADDGALDPDAPIETIEQMHLLVLATVLRIDAVTMSSMTYHTYADSIRAYDADMADAIVWGANAYRKSGVALEDFEKDVRRLGRILPTLISDVSDWRLDVSAARLHVGRSEMLSLVTSLSDNIAATLAASGAGSGVKMYDALDEFGIKLRTIKREEAGKPVDALIDLSDSAYRSLKSGLTSALTQQTYAGMMDSYTRTRLAKIFGISLSLLPTLPDDGLEGTGEKPSGGDTPGEGGGGGGGDDDNKYGSDDEIYDVEKGQVPYGDVLPKYKAIAVDWVINGDLPEDVKALILAYFNLLGGGTD